jgi:myosin-5
MLAGVDSATRSAARLQDASHYKYLAQSGCSTIEGVNDAADFRIVSAALANLGIKPEEQTRVWCLLSALLYVHEIKKNMVVFFKVITFSSFLSLSFFPSFLLFPFRSFS